MNRIQNQNKAYNNNNNQPGNAQYMKNQHMSQKPSNNILRKNITPNLNLNNRNIQNNTNQARNQNPNSNAMNNIMNNNDELGKAILTIRRECKKKDDKIRELEKKVNELTNKLRLLLKNNENNNNYLNNEFENVGEVKPFPPAQDVNIFESNDNKDGEIINRIEKNIRGYSFGYSNNKNNQRSNSYMQKIKDNAINYNSDTEKVPNQRFPGYDNMSHSNDHSILTYNGGGSQVSSKAEVKSYLKEVKSKIEPYKFKEFIRNIKLLTAKNNSTFNKDIIVESVRKIFGETNKDLFIKFQYIIGAKK
jgi:hypothetical protein